MLAKYSVNKNFFIAKPRQSDSWMWKCILQNLQQFWKASRGKSRMEQISNSGQIDGATAGVWLNLCASPTIPSSISPSLLRSLFYHLKNGILLNCRGLLINPAFKLSWQPQFRQTLFLIPSVGAFLVVENLPLDQQHGLPMC